MIADTKEEIEEVNGHKDSFELSDELFIHIFTQYIEKFPFWKTFRQDRLLSINPSYGAAAYFALNDFVKNRKNRAKVKDLLSDEGIQSKIKEQNRKDIEKYEAQSKDLKFKVPSLQDLSDYIGMHDDDPII